MSQFFENSENSNSFMDDMSSFYSCSLQSANMRKCLGMKNTNRSKLIQKKRQRIFNNKILNKINKIHKTQMKTDKKIDALIYALKNNKSPEEKLLEKSSFNFAIIINNNKINDNFNTPDNKTHKIINNNDSSFHSDDALHNLKTFTIKNSNENKGLFTLKKEDFQKKRAHSKYKKTISDEDTLNFLENHEVSSDLADKKSELILNKFLSDGAYKTAHKKDSKEQASEYNDNLNINQLKSLKKTIDKPITILNNFNERSLFTMMNSGNKETEMETDDVNGKEKEECTDFANFYDLKKRKNSVNQSETSSVQGSFKGSQCSGRIRGFNFRNNIKGKRKNRDREVDKELKDLILDS